MRAGRRHCGAASGTTAAERGSITIAAPSFTLGQVLPWPIFAGLLALVALYFVGARKVLSR